MALFEHDNKADEYIKRLMYIVRDACFRWECLDQLNEFIFVLTLGMITGETLSPAERLVSDIIVRTLRSLSYSELSMMIRDRSPYTVRECDLITVYIGTSRVVLALDYLTISW